jgi:hypothetical protein
MELLQQLNAMGLALPGPWYILGAVVFGVLGMVAWRHGRKTARPVVTWTGVVLMVYPYAVSETWLLWALGAGLSIWLYRQWNPLA